MAVNFNTHTRRGSRPVRVGISAPGIELSKGADCAGHPLLGRSSGSDKKNSGPGVASGLCDLLLFVPPAPPQLGTPAPPTTPCEC